MHEYLWGILGNRKRFADFESALNSSYERPPTKPPAACCCAGSSLVRKGLVFEEASGPLSSCSQARFQLAFALGSLLSFVASCASEVFRFATSLSISALTCSDFASPAVFRS